MPTAFSRWALAVVVVLLVASPRTARAQDGDDKAADEAAEIVERALQLYQDGRFAEAARKFEAAYALSANPGFLYSWAQAERMDGHCEQAVRLYQRFLDSEPSLADRNAATYGIEQCGVEVDKLEPKTPPSAVEPEPATPRPSATRPWYGDAIGVGLLTAGVVSLGIGGGSYLWARADLDAADSSESFGDHDELVQRAGRKRTIAVVATAVGSGLVVASLARYLWGNPDHSLEVQANGDGVALGIRGRF